MELSSPIVIKGFVSFGALIRDQIALESTHDKQGALGQQTVR